MVKDLRMEKKAAIGLPLRQLISILFGALILFFLVGLGVVVYNIVIGPSAKINQAQGSLDKLFGEIGTLEKDDDILETEVLNPDGWLISFFQGVKGSPKDCEGESCVCICDAAATRGTRQDLLDACSDERKSICKPLEYDVVDTFIEIEGVTKLNIKLNKGQITVEKIE